MKITAIIVAGGKGKRMGAGENKVFLKLLGREMLYYTVLAFENNSKTDNIVIVTSKDDMDRCRMLVDKYGFNKVTCITEGGAERQNSVMNGLEATDGDIVLIHDGARALITDKEINDAIDACISFGASAVGVRCKDTLKRVDDNGVIVETLDRESTYAVQTPQVFYKDKIFDMHKKALNEGFTATDDCMIAERYGIQIKLAEGSYDNIKLTTPEDIAVAEQILKGRGVK